MSSWRPDNLTRPTTDQRVAQVERDVRTLAIFQLVICGLLIAAFGLIIFTQMWK